MSLSTLIIIIIVIIASALHYSTEQQQNRCQKDLAIDISNGTLVNDGIQMGEYFFASHHDFYKDNEKTWGCICNVKKCIRKCCDKNQKLHKNMIEFECVKDASQSFNVTLHNGITAIGREEVNLLVASDYHLVYNGLKCRKDTNFKISLLDENDGSSMEMYVQENGDLLVPMFEDTFTLDRYCIEYFGDQLSAYVCASSFEQEEAELREMTNSLGMIISMPFLAVTFLVYLILPEKNLHRKALMIYVLTLLISYILLVSVQMLSGFPAMICSLLGYLIVFFFLSSFFWMNVMCIDMWFTFSGSRGFGGRRSTENKRFLYYCLYSFGTPILLIIIIFLVNEYGDKNSIFYPKLGKEKCFLGDGYPSLFYLYGPIGFLITVNITLFILTTMRIRKVKRETRMLKHSDSQRHSYEADKQKFNLYLKLVFAMGVNWTMEVISWAFIWKMPNNVPTAIWYLPDFTNALYGVFIFFIFVFKRKIWNSLKKRYYLFIGKPVLAQTVTMSSQSTRTSHFSTTDSTVNDRQKELISLRGEYQRSSME